MPTYQYACTECGHDFEAVQSFSDDSLTECPACQGRLRKVFGSVGVVFKGSGFYRNDSRDAKPKNGESKVKTDAKSDGAKSDAKSGKSDSKQPAAAGQHVLGQGLGLVVRRFVVGWEVVRLLGVLHSRQRRLTVAVDADRNRSAPR